MQHARFVDGACVVPRQAKKALTSKEIQAPDRRKFRGLKQFQDMTDDEFQTYWDVKDNEGTLIVPDESSEDFEERIIEKLKGFEVDYDLSDMKFNDRETLRALVQSLIQLEDLEQYSYVIRNAARGIDLNNLTLLDKVAQQMSRTRLDMLKMQEELKISRKIRQGDKSLKALDEIEKLKNLAKQFYEEKMHYIFCPKCKMLLSTAWFLYDDADNVLKFHCRRPLETGGVCDKVFEVTSAEMLAKKGSNTPEVMPETLR